MTSRRILLAAGPLGLLSVACGGGAASSGGAQSPGGAGGLVGAPAPSFSLAPVGGGAPIGPEMFKGKVLIVDFWATWCAPCRDSFPAYQRLVDKFAGKIALIGVSVDDDSNGIEKFRNETGVKFPIVWDEGQVVAGTYKPGTMPTSFVIDKNGLVHSIHEGFHKGDEAVLEKDVSSLL